MFIDLDEAPCLVVGAGPVALRRTRSLMGCGARVTIVAPRFAAGFGALGAAIMRKERPFEPADLQGMRLCVAATDDHPLNAHIADLCQNQHIAVSVASDGRLGTFHFPALVQRDNIVFGLHAGHAPALARRLRAWLDQILPAHPEDLP